MKIAGSYDTSGDAWDVFIFGDYVFVADASAGVQVIDIRDPGAPLQAGSHYAPGTAYGLAVAGEYVYVADGSSGLEVIQEAVGRLDLSQAIQQPLEIVSQTE